MKQIVRDTSAYYLIGYNSSQTPTDGKFHEIKVRVKRPGVQVRARKGYWALTAEETARATAKPKPAPPKAVTDALASVSRPSRTQVIRTWIGTSRGENGKTKVTFVWEPAAHTAADGQRDQPVARVADGGRRRWCAVFPRQDSGPAVAASAANGTPAARRRVRACARRASCSKCRPAKWSFACRWKARRRRCSTPKCAEVTVPDLTAPTTALGTPAVFRARTVRELQQLKADP